MSVMDGDTIDAGVFDAEGGYETEEEYLTAQRRRRKSLHRQVGVASLTVGMGDQAYGGPEEGGWWFDTFEPIRVITVPAKRLPSLARKLLRWAERANEGRRPKHSVISEGMYEIRDGAILRPEPAVRPHYE